MQKKEEKVEIVQELKQKLQNSRSVFLADFTGLNVEEITKLRRSLKEKEAEFKIAKNSLTRLAAQETGQEGILQYLKGPLSLTFSYGDPSWTAKILADFHKRLEKPKVKAFFIDHQFFPAEKLTQWANLPPQEVVVAELLGVLNSPLSNLVGVLNGIIRNFLGTLESLVEKKSTEQKSTEQKSSENQTAYP